MQGDCVDLRATGPEGAATTRALPEEDATIRDTKQLILRLDCSVPHQYEVISVVEHRPAGGATDDASLVAVAKQLCPAAFTAYIGTPYPSSDLDVGWILPGPEQRNRPMLQIGCLAFDPAGKLTSTVRGSGR